MPWFKIDDGYWSHPKVLELSDAAVALWVRAGSYCAGHLTDGVVKKSTLRVLGADRDAAVELVIAGLWDETDDSWAFHDWKDYQPTREEVLAERAAATERKRRSRARSQGESRRDTGGTHDGGHSPPSRPDPTRPDHAGHQSMRPPVDNSTGFDETVEVAAKSVLAGLEIDPPKLVAHISRHTGRNVSTSTAMKVALGILDRAGEVKTTNERLVFGSIKTNWAETQQEIDEAA